MAFVATKTHKQLSTLPHQQACTDCPRYRFLIEPGNRKPKSFPANPRRPARS